MHAIAAFFGGPNPATDEARTDLESTKPTRPR
jgi:hypothetical protein